MLERLAQGGTTMVLVTHEMGFARRSADSIVFMHQGRVWEKGPPAKLLGAPQTAELASFIEAILSVDPTRRRRWMVASSSPARRARQWLSTHVAISSSVIGGADGFASSHCRQMRSAILRASGSILLNVIVTPRSSGFDFIKLRFCPVDSNLLSYENLFFNNIVSVTLHASIITNVHRLRAAGFLTKLAL